MALGNAREGNKSNMLIMNTLRGNKCARVYLLTSPPAALLE